MFFFIFEGLPGFWGTVEDNRLFQKNGSFFRLILGKKELQLIGSLTKHFREQRNLLIGNKVERGQGNMPPSPHPLAREFTSVTKLWFLFFWFESRHNLRLARKQSHPQKIT